MTKPLAVVASDTHLRRCTWLRHPALAYDSYVSFLQIVDYCVVNKADLMLAGDIHDDMFPASFDVIFCREHFDRLQQAGVRVFYICGNHDLVSPPWLSFHPWPQHVDQRAFQIGPFTFYGLDYRPSHEIKQAVADLPAVDALLMHQAWSNVQPIGHTDLSIDDLRVGGDKPIHIFSGDYHVTKAYPGVVPGTQRPITIYSPGSTAMQAINEPPNKFFLVLSEQAGQLAVTPQQLVTRGYYEFVCNTEQELQVCLAAVMRIDIESGKPAQIAKPIVRVQFNDRIQEAGLRIQAAIGDRAHLFSEPKHTTENIVVSKETTKETAFNNLSAAVQTLDVSEGKTLSAGVLRLLQSSNPQAELEAMYAEHMAQ